MVARRTLTPLVVAAFAAVYVIWGSTYLAIRLAIDTIPPLLMAGVRFVVAGAILFPIAWLGRGRAGERLTAAHWRSALVIGVLLLTAGNGGISFAELHVASGVAALLVATVPLWMAVIGHLRGGERISRIPAGGLALGFAGVALLVLRPEGSSGSAVWLAFTLLPPICWAAGSIYARGAPLPRRPLLGTAMEMLCGGAVLCFLSGLLGEWGQLHLTHISLTSGLALLYLIAAGSLIAFSAYVYLLATVPARAVSSYAYVNPLVAVGLGWAFLGEGVGATTLVAAALIVAAVAVLLSSRGRTATASTAAASPAPGEEIA